MEFFRKKIVFVTIIFGDNPKVYDYPKHLPIPATNDTVILNNEYGTVERVHHITINKVSTIEIFCK